MLACAMLCGASSILAAPAAASKDAVPTAKAASGSKTALRLSELLNPPDQLEGIALRGFETGFDAALKSNPDDAALFTDNPGLREAIFEAARPIFRKYVAAQIPAKEQKFADFYARKFTPQDMEELLAFYSSPTGTKVIAQTYANLDLNKIAEDALATNGEGKMNGEDVGEITTSAAAKVLPGLDADDFKALFIFSGTPAFEKLRAAMPEFQQLTAELANETDPATDAEVQAAVEGAVKKYMAQKDSAPKH